MLRHVNHSFEGEVLVDGAVGVPGDEPPHEPEARLGLNYLLAATRWARCRDKRRLAYFLGGIERSIFALWDLLVAVLAAGFREALAIVL